MSLVRVVRGADDIRCSIEAANEFLVNRPHCFPEPRELDEVLGLWGRRERDADLPVRFWLDGERGLR